jgi:hypothetical protein
MSRWTLGKKKESKEIIDVDRSALMTDQAASTIDQQLERTAKP